MLGLWRRRVWMGMGMGMLILVVGVMRLDLA